MQPAYYPGQTPASKGETGGDESVESSGVEASEPVFGFGQGAESDDEVEAELLPKEAAVPVEGETDMPLFGSAYFDKMDEVRAMEGGEKVLRTPIDVDATDVPSEGGSFGI